VKRAALLAMLAVLAGCSSTEETWGGYTENEAKDILALPNVRETVINNTPRTVDERPVAQIYPTAEELEDSDLLKTTVQGQETWEYRDEINAFCLNVWEDPESQTYFAQSSHCVAD
jgi:hypothetical protein